MRLGLEWHNAQSCHSMIDDSLHPIGSQPFLTVDGDHVGLHTTQRFVEEIRALGCSNSSSDLGRIAELLDEHEGEDIPLCTQHMGSWDNQFAWMPQRSPIEFSHCLSAPGHNTRIPWDPASLGLVCARLDCQGKPMADEHTLHLLQLGYLCMRPASDIEQSEWISSGHIVAWDRVNGGFVAIFVGKGHGVISSGYLPSSLPSPSRGLLSVATTYNNALIVRSSRDLPQTGTLQRTHAQGMRLNIANPTEGLWAKKYSLSYQRYQYCQSFAPLPHSLWHHSTEAHPYNDMIRVSSHTTGLTNYPPTWSTELKAEKEGLLGCGATIYQVLG
ncbi:hypothetical protein DTO164E3_2858 [Paecilomyces variotii]|nr:hypothetical protein DTO032I3_4737 [Paecilomyces variotii]KAJ9202885.1 hypothetical protein DTO164E3_2858 [Paecilomyces variotii]KAJ9278746.1 hypothetical protein DTO021D3_4369 [Paecilomyces variotii]KAJ9289651.1 hypothetical protein DTO021C3_2722 [Paecilomyces variotii]KAJ9309047.1 hypothetical protein DTO217A2_1416 [Paecilomyces variotii]